MTETKTKNVDMCNLICGLKNALTALECQQKADMQKKLMTGKKQQENSKMYLMIPIEGKKLNSSNNDKGKSSKKNETDEKVKNKKQEKKMPQEEEDLCVFVAPEMRGGVLYNKCSCLARNGLQDDCPLTLCQGQPDCLIKPWPECPPGKYFRSRHPDIYPSPNTAK